MGHGQGPSQGREGWEQEPRSPPAGQRLPLHRGSVPDDTWPRRAQGTLQTAGNLVTGHFSSLQTLLCCIRELETHMGPSSNWDPQREALRLLAPIFSLPSTL